MNHRVTRGIRGGGGGGGGVCHVELEWGTLGTWVGQVSCPQTLHEMGGCELGMENTWPSKGHVSN